ncbi:MAG: pyruvate ferredoxin oxidoreductase [Desulfuromonadaceae bacterium]|nr:pyruvate ferredoxin oxidoreductase [Desulfuromonadaceae bacterium]
MTGYEDAGFDWKSEKRVGATKFLTGLGAVAHALKMADIDVASSYPIRPYTGAMMMLSQMAARGELDVEFVHGEGEHGQLGIAHGASAAGARAFTGSSGVGVMYAMEVYSPISGGRCPVQMLIGNRTLDPPGDFGSEHTDALSTRDQCWIMGWAHTPQEAFDNTLMYYRIGEDPRVYLPQMNCQDGYFITHIPMKVVVPTQEKVDKFLPPLSFPDALDPLNPLGHGPQLFPGQGHVLEATRVNAMMGAFPVIDEVVQSFNSIFETNYSPFVDLYRCEDAEYVLFISGGHAYTAKFAINHMREKGMKIGLVRPRFIRPWATDVLADILSKFKAIGVVETNNAFGAARQAGILTLEVATTLYQIPNKPVLTAFMGGLGGEVIRLDEFYYMGDVLAKAAKEGKTERTAYWIGFHNI